MTVVAVSVPCSVPVPVPRAAVTTVPLSVERKLPKASAICTAGCWAKATPAVAVAEGCVCIASLLAAPGLITTLSEVTSTTPPLAKSRVMVVATLCERLVNVTRPPDAVRFVVPCNVPLPALRVAVTTVLLSLLRKLSNSSSTRRTGCWAKSTPAVAVAEGCVCIAKWSAAAALTAMVLEVALVRLSLVN